MKFLLLLLLLVACATISYDELFQQASECTAAKAIGCEALWAEVNRRDELKDRRKKKNEHKKCPDGGVVLRNDWGHESCISRDALRRILNGRGY